MIKAALLFVNSLEKLNLILCSPILSQKEISKGKKIITTLYHDVQEFNDNINLLKSSQLKKKSVDEGQLAMIISSLNIIIKKLKKIYKLGIIAAQTLVSNMDAEGYSDEK